MRHSSSRELFEYWDRIRRGRPAPRREEIEPSDIRLLLADTFILDVSGKLRTVSYRLAGTRLCAAFGRELKGLGFLVSWVEEDCFDVAKLLSSVYRDSSPRVLSLDAITDGGQRVGYEMLLLPLLPMADGTTRILGVATSAEMPYWLGAVPVTQLRLRHHRAISGIRVTDSETPPLAPSLQVAGKPAMPTPLPVSDERRRVAHLVVHQGGKA